MPGIKRTRTHADEFKDLQDNAPIEFDPEDDAPIEESSDDGSALEDEGGRTFSGREHYEPVGKSRLRQRDSAALGPQYAGSSVTRTRAGPVDEEHDPFAEYGSEDDSDMDNLVDRESEEVEQDLDGDSPEGSDDSGAGTDDTSLSDDPDEEMETSRLAKDDRAELRRIMDEQSNVAATISQATKLDAEKGRAVKSQRRTFDSLLNTRIRMQQGLVAVNSMQAETTDTTSGDSQEAYVAAESAALNLWNTIESLQHRFASHSRSTKPAKPLTIDASTPSSKIWTHMQAREAQALANRNTTLDKWSRKTASATAHLQQTTTRHLGPDPTVSAQPQQGNITAVLADHLSSTNIPRLVARTRIPRSCAPLQAAAKVPPTANIYDDADFYAHLLQELLTQRQLDDLAPSTVGGAAQVSGGGGGGGDVALTQQYRAARAASKTKKDVDTKASKGRKIRYTVHEKLQNFMAPEDRGAWGQRQREELFGSLLGRRLVLEEREEEEDVVAEGSGDGYGGGRDEEEALMLFRS